VSALAGDRQHFREVLAEIAQSAKTKLPVETNGRVEHATKLVLQGDVTVQADGTVQVGSSTDPTLTYTLAHGQCTCQDFQRGQAPGGWCQHRIARALYHRVRERLASEAPQDEPLGIPRDLPEAPSSVNVRVLIQGHECQITLRDHDEGALLARLQTLLSDKRIAPVPTPRPRSGGQQWKRGRQYQGAA
jgi:hypothetical protein